MHEISNHMFCSILTILIAVGCLGLVMSNFYLPFQLAVGASNCSGSSNSTCSNLHSNDPTISTPSKVDSKVTHSRFVDSSDLLSADKKEIGPTVAPFILPFP